MELQGGYNNGPNIYFMSPKKEEKEAKIFKVL